VHKVYTFPCAESFIPRRLEKAVTQQAVEQYRGDEPGAR
jgi:hypothetical protein